ncbi:MAG TPA: hypothetical protein VGG40_06275, partial [Solirubrobacterales bacterium]
PGRCLRLAPLLLACLALTLALPACGSQSSTAAESTAAKTTVSSGEPAAAPKPAPGGAPCDGSLGDFVEELEHLRRNLVIGVSYEQYVSELGSLRKSYDQVPVGKLELSCIAGPATSAESSFDRYLAAANTWGDCVSEAGCETAALEPELRHQWRRAAKQLAAAKQELAAD